MSRECPQGGGSGGRRGPRTCHKCGMEGHISRDCTNPASNGESSGGGGGFGGGFGKPSGGFGAPNGSVDDDQNSKPSGFGGGFGRSSGGFGAPSGTLDESDNSKPSGFGGGFGNGPSANGAGFGGGFGGGDEDTVGGGGFGGRSGGDDTCRICKQSGHFARDCPDKPPRDDTCRNCGESGHFARDCTSEPKTDPNRPAPVTYIPPEPSENEEDLFRTIAQGINFSNYDNIPVEVTGPGTIPSAIRDFSEAGLPENILENVGKAKYVKPTPVQKYALPIIMGERDLMSCAQTSSGKTVSIVF